MPRQARFDSPGTLHHVMVRGIEGAEIVHGMKDCEEFVKRMGRLASEMGIKIYAWALMANHAHILQRSGPSGLPRYTRRFLSSYARYYNRSTTGMGTSSRTAINRLCAMRQSEAEENSDEKVLGSGEFVDRLLAEAEEKIKRQLPPRELTRRVRGIVEKACARLIFGRLQNMTGVLFLQSI